MATPKPKPRKQVKAKNKNKKQWNEQQAQGGGEGANSRAAFTARNGVECVKTDRKTDSARVRSEEEGGRQTSRQQAYGGVVSGVSVCECKCGQRGDINVV